MLIVRHRLSLLAVMAVLVTGLFLPQQASAVPAFARQMDSACSSCHYMDFPALNAFGRFFKQSAYTLQAGQKNVESDKLSIVASMNESLLTKVRYQKSNGSTAQTDTGEFQFPDEAALLIGGRAGNHIGFLMEFGTFGSADTGSGAVNAGVADTGSGDFSLFSSFKAHFNYPVRGVNYGAVVFTTDSGGASYGFELLNTGAQRFIRPVEDRTAGSAQQFLGLGSGAAEGVALVASGSQGFVNLSFWTPDHGPVAVNSFANYLRAVYTPAVGSWDAAVGLQWFGGTASRSAASNGDIDTDAWAVDGQLQGTLRGKAVGFYAGFGQADSGSNNHFNGAANRREAWSLLGEVGVIQDKATLYLGYLNGDNGSDPALGANEDNRLLIGGSWRFVQNVELQVWNTSYSGNQYDPKPADGGDNTLSVMLFSGF